MDAERVGTALCYGTTVLADTLSWRADMNVQVRLGFPGQAGGRMGDAPGHALSLPGSAMGGRAAMGGGGARAYACACVCVRVCEPRWRIAGGPKCAGPRRFDFEV